MPLYEDTLASWSASPSQSERDRCDNAVSVVRKAIAANAKLSALNPSVFPQGSYRSLTNVRQGSDVDICVRYNDSFFTDYPAGFTDSTFGFTTSVFTYAEFKNLVGEALVGYFGQNRVHRGSKAFDIHANTYHLDADVVPTFAHLKYSLDKNYIKGVAFNPDSGGRIVNWPDQNDVNGVARNKEAQRMYKRTIRILKRLRNRMQEEDMPEASGISSFLIECLVWNVHPPALLKETYKETIRQVIIDIYSGTETDQKCADWYEVNMIKKLFENAPPGSRERVRTFMQAAWNYIGYAQ